MRAPEPPRAAYSAGWRAAAPGVLALAATLLLPAACGSGAGRADPAPASLRPGTHTFTLDHDGVRRRYHVHVPPAARTEGPLPVLLAFHGGGGNGDQFRRSSGIAQHADREGFLAVFPDGSGRLRALLTWNAGACCGFARDAGRDDVGFVAALLDDLARRTPVELARIYATGHSNGAMMTYRLAAELADRIAAAAPVGGAMTLDRFAPVRAVPILHIHSVDDPRALYEGGQGPAFPGTDRTIEHRPVQAGLDAWIRHNGCPTRPTEGRTLSGPAAGRNAGQRAVELRWEPCTSGAPVAHWRLTGVGHGWPGQVRSPLPEALIGPDTTLLDAAAEVWRFVSQYRLDGG